MEILNKNAALLSNYEVYDLLKKTKEELALKLIKKKKLDSNTANLDNLNLDKHLPTIVYESLQYLEKTTPCASQSPQLISDFLQKLDEKSGEYKLTKIEKLEILNLRPNNAVELQAIIDDSEERFTIEQMDSLLEFIQVNLNNGSEEPMIEDNIPQADQE
jgi:hypothetical protein